MSDSKIHRSQWAGVLNVSLSLIVLLATATSVAAGETDAGSEIAWRPFLYEIEHPDRSADAHLFGTIHLPDKRLRTLPAPVQTAIDQADAVIMEIDIAKEQATAMSLMLLPPGESLREILPDDLYRESDKYFKTKGCDLASFDHLKIWAVMTMMVILDYSGEIAMPLDYTIYSNAAMAGKEVGGLETAEEQVGVFDRFTREEQIEMLRLSLRDMKEATVDPVQLGVESYLSGNSDHLLESMYMVNDFNDPLMSRLLDAAITQRDKRLADRIAERLLDEPAKSYFFGVGAGHLIEETSILHHLKEKGFKVTRVGAAPTQDNASVSEEPATLKPDVGK